MKGVFFLSNNGNSWTALNNGLENKSIGKIEVITNTNILVCSYGNGVFLTTDNGNSWTSMNTGLSNLNTLSLVICGTDLFVGTGGSGLFKNSNILTSNVDLENDNFTSSFRPNPSAGIITIKNSSDIHSIEILNLLGEKIFEKKINETQTEIDLRHHPKGIYFARLLDDKKIVATHKILIEN